ncbi:hypothetical protein Tco_0646054 [Tanacetum coccineum]
MSSLFTVTYTSVYTDSEPVRVFWGADEELFDGGSPRVIVYGYDGLPMQPVAPPSPDYVPGPEHPPSPDYVPSPEHPPSPIEVPYVPEPEYPEYLVPSDAEAPLEDQPLPTDASPITLSPGYDEPSDDDDTDDEDEEPFEDEDDDEEEEHLAPADSSAIPVVDPVPSAEDTEAFETNEAAPTPVPSPRRHMARMSVRPQTPILLPSEAEVKRLLSLPIPPPSPLSPWSYPLPQIPSPPIPPPPSSLHLPSPVPTSLPLPSSLLPPLPALLSIPPPSRNEVDPAEVVEEVAPTTLEGVNARVTELATVQEHDTQDIYAVIEDGQDRQTQLSQRVDILIEDVRLSSAVHYELQAYRTHTQMQDYRIASQESLTATFIAHVSLLQGQLLAALGQIHALQARDQTHADDPKGAGYSA